MLTESALACEVVLLLEGGVAQAGDGFGCPGVSIRGLVGGVPHRLVLHGLLESILATVDVRWSIGRLTELLALRLSRLPALLALRFSRQTFARRGLRCSTPPMLQETSRASCRGGGTIPGLGGPKSVT